MYQNGIAYKRVSKFTQKCIPKLSAKKLLNLFGKLDHFSPLEKIVRNNERVYLKKTVSLLQKALLDLH
jgi:hypothetical protein